MAFTRKALVTGATQGIGKAIAVALVRDGFEVVVGGRDRDRAEAVRDEIGAAGELAADLSTPGGIEFAAHAVAHLGFDVLVHNASSMEVGVHPLLETSALAYERLMRLHAWGPLEMSRAALPGMLERDAQGRIIWISSEGALMPRREQAAGPYLTSKWAMLELSRLFADEARGSTVTSNALIVGPTRTETTEQLTQGLGMDFDRAVALGYPGHLAGRPAEPREVAEAVAFLASPASIVFRGAVLRAEGGSLPTVLP